MRPLCKPLGLPSRNGGELQTRQLRSAAARARCGLFCHVGFAGEIEIDLHGAGAQHHIEAARANLWHIGAHDFVTLLRHPRNIFALGGWMKTDAEKTDAEFFAKLVDFDKMLDRFRRLI